MSAQPNIAPAANATPLRIGFVGLGWIGRKRLDAVAMRTDIAVAALVDSDAERMHEAQQAYSQATVSTQFEALLDADLDGIVIATPNAQHAEQAIACLERGIAVFCQKPLASRAADVERVVAAAREADRLLGVDFSYRHVQGMAALRERILRGDLGEISAIDLIFHNDYGPNKQWCFDRQRSGGGCLLDLGVHLIDLALWLQNAPNMRVKSSRLYSQGRRASSNDIEDLAFVELEQENGAVIRIACSWNAQIGCGAQISADVHGTRGGAQWRNVDGSFVDFNLDLTRGDQRERLGASRDDWGPGALGAWIDALRVDPRFEPGIALASAGSRLIDQAYDA